MNMKAASAGLMRLIAESECFLSQFIPVHIVHVVGKGHGVRYDFKAVIQAAVTFDIYGFGELVGDLQ